MSLRLRLSWYCTGLVLALTLTDKSGALRGRGRTWHVLSCFQLRAAQAAHSQSTELRIAVESHAIPAQVDERTAHGTHMEVRTA